MEWCRGVVPDVGFEPTTYRLQGGCSTTELIRRDVACVDPPLTTVRFYQGVIWMARFLTGLVIPSLLPSRLSRFDCR